MSIFNTRVTVPMLYTMQMMILVASQLSVFRYNQCVHWAINIQYISYCFVLKSYQNVIARQLMKTVRMVVSEISFLVIFN